MTLKSVQAVPAPPGSACARHAHVPAIIVCERCGDFCGECCAVAVGESAYCERCVGAAPRPAGIVRRFGAGWLDYYLTFGILLVASPVTRVFGVSDSVKVRNAVFAVSIPAAVFLIDVILLARRSQTLGSLTFGTHFTLPDRRKPSIAMLIVGRRIAPLVSFLVAGTIPYGIAAVVAANFGLMYFSDGRTLVDIATRTLVAVREKAG